MPKSDVKPKKKRVMEVITRLIHGGAQETTVLIVLRLLKEGYQVVFAHGPGDESLLKRLPKDNPDLQILYVPEFRRRILPHWDFLALWRIYRYIRKHPVDLVHTHTSKAGIIGRWAARLAGVKVICHSPRGSIYHPTYWSERTLRFFAFLERMTAKFSRMIITLNESEKGDYIRYGIAPKEKFTTIYSGVEVKRYVDLEVNIPEKKKSLGLPLDKPIIGYVSRITPEKGHELCLQAFEKVHEAVPEAILAFVGGGPLEQEIRQKVESHPLRDKIIMTGGRTDISEIIRVFDICVQSSLWDGLPRAMIECMLGEKAVVATRVGGIPEIIHHRKTGILVKENDAEDLAQGMMELLRNKDLRDEIGQNARRRMEDVFDVDASVEKLFALYEYLMNGKSE